MCESTSAVMLELRRRPVVVISASNPAGLQDGATLGYQGAADVCVLPSQTSLQLHTSESTPAQPKHWQRDNERERERRPGLADQQQTHFTDRASPTTSLSSNPNPSIVKASAVLTLHEGPLGPAAESVS